jgi:hypothetical protein
VSDTLALRLTILLLGLFNKIIVRILKAWPLLFQVPR